MANSIELGWLNCGQSVWSYHDQTKLPTYVINRMKGANVRINKDKTWTPWNHRLLLVWRTIQTFLRQFFWNQRKITAFKKKIISLVTLLLPLHIQNSTFSHFSKRLQTKALPKNLIYGTSTHLNFFICIIKNEQSKDVCFLFYSLSINALFLYSIALLYMIAQENKSRLPHLNAIGKLKGHV